MSQFKGLLSLLLAQTLYLCCPLSLSNRTQIHHRQGNGQWCSDELLWFSHGKGGTQNLVTAHNLIDALLQCARLEGTVQMQCRADIVERRVWLQLIQEP